MTTVTHYTSSKGLLIEIRTMVFSYANNAANVLRRSGDPSRADELAALDAHLAHLAVEYRQNITAERDTASPERVAEIDEILAKMDAAG